MLLSKFTIRPVYVLNASINGPRPTKITNVGYAFLASKFAVAKIRADGFDNVAPRQTREIRVCTALPHATRKKHIVRARTSPLARISLPIGPTLIRSCS